MLQIIQGGILSTSETAKTKVKKVKKVTGNGLLVSNKCYGKGNPVRPWTNGTVHKSIRRAQGSKIKDVDYFKFVCFVILVVYIFSGLILFYFFF